MAELTDSATEAAVVAGCIWDQETALEVAGYAKPDWFRGEAARRVIQAVQSLAASTARSIGLAEIIAEMRRQGTLDAPTESWVRGLRPQGIGDPALHLRRLQALHQLRQYVLQARQITEARDIGDPEKALAALERSLEATLAETMAPILSGEELAASWWEIFQRRGAGDADATGWVSESFAGVMRMAHGLRPRDLWLLAGQTGIGKSYVATVLATDLAQGGVPVLYLNSEMDRQLVADRIISRWSGVPFGRLQGGTYTAEELTRLEDARRTLAATPIWVSDPLPDLTPARAMAWARRYAAKGMRVLVLDYLGALDLGRDTARWIEREDQVLTQIAKRLKGIAKELGVAVVAVVQLTWDGHLQGAKAMANWADVMLQISEVDQGSDDDMIELGRMGLGPEQAPYWLTVSKNRRGRTVRAPLAFDPEAGLIGEVGDAKPVARKGGKRRGRG